MNPVSLVDISGTILDICGDCNGASQQFYIRNNTRRNLTFLFMDANDAPFKLVGQSTKESTIMPLETKKFDLIVIAKKMEGQRTDRDPTVEKIQFEFKMKIGIMEESLEPKQVVPLQFSFIWNENPVENFYIHYVIM